MHARRLFKAKKIELTCYLFIFNQTTSKMGQYYYPIVLSADGKIVVWMLAHRYGNGLKLTEHSFIGNNFVSTFEFGLSPEGIYHKSRVVWAGDYADNEPNLNVENRLFCFYQEVISLEDPHTDKRTLWRFRHRQPKRSNEFDPSRIYDHGAKDPKELICEECLGKVIQASLPDQKLKCFNFGQDACEGYFHPNEIQGKVSNELY